MASALSSVESNKEAERISNKKNLYHDLKEYLIAINELSTKKAG